MGKRANGGVLGVVNTPTTNKASGLWSLAEVALYKKAGTWPSIATFALSVDSASVNKGGSFTVTLTTTGVADGTLVPYEITGIAAEDLSSGSLTGNFTVTSNTGSLTFTTASSGGTSGDLTAAFTCGGDTETITFQEGDTYFKYVTALLHGDGTNAANNKSFTDSSTNAFSITRNGETTQGTFTPYGDTWSNYFDGSTSFVNLPTASSVFALGTGALTVEAWVFVTKSSAYQGIFSTLPVGATGVGFGLYVTNADKLGFSVGNGSSGTDVVSAASISFNTWVHVAATRAATTGAITLYVNGTSVATGTAATSITNQDAIVGRQYTNSSGSYLQGYISNVRVSNTVRTITVPTAPYSSDANTLFLVNKSNRFIDTSSNALTLSATATSVQKFSPFSPTAAYSTSGLGGSAYFDGSGDYLATATTSSFAFGTNNFTIEGWVYMTAYTATGCCMFGTVNGSTSGYYINLGSDINSLRVTSNASGSWADTISVSSGNGVPLNAWTHIALVRNGSSLILYKNGVNVANTSSAGSYNFTSPSNVGYVGYVSNGSSTQYFQGYMSDIRVSNSALSISVPTSPLSSSGSVLCLSATNGGIIDNAMMNDWVTVGDVQVNTDTATKKYGSGSLKFDGTGDYLTSPYIASQNLSTGDFTIEMWAYFSSLGASVGLFHKSYTTDGNTWQGMHAFVSTAGTINFETNDSLSNGATGARISSTSNVSTGTWYHLAFVRSSGTTTIYLNGTSVGSGSNSGSCDNTYGLGIGLARAGTTWPMNGYIDDIRISKGYARYTSNFTAPTGAFQDR